MVGYYRQDKWSDSMMLYEKLVDYLKGNHTDSSECISARKLGVRFNVSGQEIRSAVNKARQEGIPICACGDGYSYSELPSDILKTINSLTGRIAKMQTAINGLTLKAYESMER